MENINNTYTADTAAAMLGVTVRTLRRWAKTGKIKRLIIGNNVQYQIPDTEHSSDQVSNDTMTGHPDTLSAPARTGDKPPGHDVQDDNGFIVLRDAFQGSTAMARQLQQDNQELKGRIAVNQDMHKKQVFNLRLMAGFAIATAVILTSVLFLGYGLYIGRGKELFRSQHALTATTQQLDRTGSRADRAEARADKLTVTVMDLLEKQHQPETPKPQRPWWLRWTK